MLVCSSEEGGRVALEILPSFEDIGEDEGVEVADVWFSEQSEP
jgi:hypothetical protein